MKKIFLCLFVAVMTLSACNRSVQIVSPDGKTKVHFAVNNGVPTYSVEQDGETIIAPSVLGLITTTRNFSANRRILGVEKNAANYTWETVWGEERFITDCHNEATIHLNDIDIIFRVFNDGLALRYVLTTGGELTIIDEATEYRFPETTEAWSIPWRTEYYESLWAKDRLQAKDTMCSPITMELPQGRFAFLHEAALTDYPAQNFYYQDGAIRTFLTPWLDDSKHELDDKAYVTTPFATPWRMIILTRNLPDLMASRIMLNLNEPCRIDDTSWIKPMKFLGIWWGMHLHQWTWRLSPIHGATTANMQRYLQFAADHNIGGVLAEGWNVGWEGYEGIDPTARFSFVTPYADYDMEYLSQFAREHGVQIISHHETCGNAAQYENEMAEAYDYMNAHGITSVKTGYVSPILLTRDNHQYNRSQAGVRHYRRVIECAAQHHVCIDNHEPVMPTGLQRTYPNLMTQEGIRGQEWNAWSQDGGSPADHVCILPFTRMMAGPADYTPGIFGFENPVFPSTRAHSTLANQLALFVTIYSPLQMACDLVENYERFPDMFRFIEQVPCDWQRSRLVDGNIGEFVVMARQDRASDAWYVGATTNDDAREITIPLNFLEDERAYKATIYADAPDADWQSNPYAHQITERTVTANDTITLYLASGGGCAISLE